MDDLTGSQAVDVLGALNHAFEEITTLKFRAVSSEERLANLEDAKEELKEKVARLERLQTNRTTVELKEPGNPVAHLKRS